MGELLGDGGTCRLSRQAGARGAAHPPLCRIQPRQHQGEDVEAALSVGLLGDAAPLQQHGLGRERRQV